MSSLKDIKSRIGSVKSTRKITSAMKLVSSAKLRRAQYKIERFLPYQEKLSSIFNNFLSSDQDYVSPLSVQREINAVAIVVISSNSSLCGAFNANIIRLFYDTLNKYKDMSRENIYIYPIGKKVEDTLKKEGIRVQGGYAGLIEYPNFEDARQLTDGFINDFISRKIDRVELLYNHFKSSSTQVPVNDRFLPIDFGSMEKKKEDTKAGSAIDYIVEPDKVSIVELLMPKSLRTKMYAALLDSAAAEQAARMIAMQVATENANELLDELSIQYNKQRQQAITNELLDIVSGSEAQK